MKDLAEPPAKRRRLNRPAADGTASWTAGHATETDIATPDLRHRDPKPTYAYPPEYDARLREVAQRVLQGGRYGSGAPQVERVMEAYYRHLNAARREYDRKWGSAPKDPTWANKTWMYLYADKTGVKSGEGAFSSTFADLESHIPYFKELDARVLYFLPVTSSPMMDGGYDVSDYRSVRDELGGDAQFLAFVEAARKNGLDVVMDFVPGHTSEEHAWFQKALKGDIKHMDYFIHTPEPPVSELVERDGDSLRRYHDRDFWGNPRQYERLLIFPDLSQQHYYPRDIESPAGVTWREHFYSTFYPFQVDLDLQNPDVLDEHFGTLSHWLTSGVKGIRGDAAPWWVKVPGHEGADSDQAHALGEMFNTFIRSVNPELLYLPEAVGQPEVTSKYLGEPTQILGYDAMSKSTSCFAFEKSVQLLYAGLSGDFQSFKEYIWRSESLAIPSWLPQVLYPLHHDEIYLGMLKPHAKAFMQDRILGAGGVNFKGGNSGGATVAALFDHDHDRMFQHYKLMFGCHGAPAIYQGTELGVGNAWSHAIVETFRQLGGEMRRGKLDASHPVFAEARTFFADGSVFDALLLDPAAWRSFFDDPKQWSGQLVDSRIRKALPLESAMRPFVDGRLLHRNTVSSEELQAAARGDNAFFNRFKALPHLKHGSPALLMGEVEQLIDVREDKALAFARRHMDSAGVADDEVIVVKNATDRARTISLHEWDVRGLGLVGFHELEQQRDVPFGVDEEPGGRRWLTVHAKAHETLWLQMRREALDA